MSRGLPLVLLIAACVKPAPAPAPVDAGPRVVLGGARPAPVWVPRGYTGKPTPLIIALHGYGNSGQPFEKYLGLSTLDALVVAPDGTLDEAGHRFWNAGSDACCNFQGRAVDDVKYLRELLSELRSVYNVDPRRIFVIGHSNGGFMAYRLACEMSEELAAVVSLAGATVNCQPRRPVSVLQIHGDRDVGVRFEGGTNILRKGGGPYPGARETTARWAQYDGCHASTARAATPLDLDAELAGAETIVSTHEGCPRGGDVTLWTIERGSHVPEVSAAFAGLVWTWLQAHPRP